MGRPARFGRRDDGQMGTALSLFLAIGMIFIAIRMILPVGEAADKQSRAQVAADAAALAAVHGVAWGTVERWKQGFSPGQWGAVPLRCGDAAARAGTFAGKNDATATTTCWNGSDEVSVNVTLKSPTIDGRQAKASARASLGVNWSGCTWSPATVPTPPTTTTTTKPTTTTTTKPTTTTTTTTKPPANVNAELRCGSVKVRFLWKWTSLRFEWNDDEDDVREALEKEARLIG